MRLIPILLIGALTGVAIAAHAEVAPVLSPTRDVAVTYRVSGANRTNGAAVIKFTFADHDEKVRLDLYALEGARVPFDTLIYDKSANRILSLIHTRNVYFERSATGRANPGLMLGASMLYKKIGSKTIAGHTCTDWQVLDGSQPKGTACVTDDGIVLHGTRLHPLGGLEAIAVKYGTPPPSTFEPDPGMILHSK